MARITLQKGHCFRKSGATGGRGEQGLADNVGNTLASLLKEAGHDVVVVLADQSVPNNRDIFIALHSDGSTDPRRHGASVGYPNDGASYRLAAAWKRAHERAGYRWGWNRDNYTTGLARYYGFADAAGYKFRFLAEHGMHSNPEEYEWMHADYRRLAMAHFAAIGELVGHPKPIVTPGPITPTDPGDPTPTTMAITSSALTDGRVYTFSRDGGVFTEGGAEFLGTPPAGHRPIVAGRATPGNGYLLAADDGGVFGFGDAGWFGSLGGIPLNGPIMDMFLTPSGQGYVLLGADGGTFHFGDAGPHGSAVGHVPNLTEIFVTGAYLPQGGGYVLVKRNGGVFTFGDAQYHGSITELGLTLNKPVEGILMSPSGRGYSLVTGDGGIFNFGDARPIQPYAPLQREVMEGHRYVEDAEWFVPGEIACLTTNLGERYLLS